jgi:dolichol-phosphate mannosyltransferase
VPLEVQSLAEWESAGVEGLLSVVIPAHDEAGNLEETLRSLAAALARAGIEHEILVVDDGSTDDTGALVRKLAHELHGLRCVENPPPHGYGFAVRQGLSLFRGEYVAIVMADGSDDPEDVVAFYRKIREGYDCVFGTRFARDARVVDYPWPKLALNRLANTLVRMLFLIRYNDVSNAYKMYHRRVIAGVQPLLSQHFNLTVEIPLKAIVRGYSYAVLPNSWRNRKQGISKFRIHEMGSRYLFIILYCLLEKLLSRGDYAQATQQHSGQLQVWPK